MTIPQINLPPTEKTQPRRARIPTERALRWLAPNEDQEHQPAVVSVFVSQEAYVRCCAHAGSDLENEVGGWLVGKWRADKATGRQYIVVEASLPARHTRQGSAFLTFTQDSQVAMYAEFQERFPNKELVGWYHTHPRMGVFLSSHDTWLHRNFFLKRYQVALVIEPYSVSGGFFIWNEDGELDAHHYYGFYELNEDKTGRRRERSVVHWQNMLLETEIHPVGETSEQGEQP